MTPEQVRAVAREIGASNEIADYLERVCRDVAARAEGRA